MKHLIEKFSVQNIKAQELISNVQASLVEGIAPSEQICELMSSSLASLRSTYQAIKTLASSSLTEEEMPVGDAPVSEYEAAVNNSAQRQKHQIINVLEVFLSTRSSEMRYDEALEESRMQAKLLLDELRSDSFVLPDVTAWDAFNRGVPCDDFDSEAGTEILDIVSEKFPVIAVRGLMLKKYQVTPSVVSEISKISAEQHPSSSAIASTPATSGESNGAESKSISEADVQDDSSNKNEVITESLDQTTYIHPRRPLKLIKLPSEQKLKEHLRYNENVWRFIIEKLNFLTAMRETVISNWVVTDRFSKEMCLSSLHLLENKGYIAAYEYNDETWYCVTPLLSACLKKDSLNKLVKRILGIKKIGEPVFEAQQDMPISLFSVYAAALNSYHDFIDALNQYPECLKLLPTATWHSEEKCININLCVEGEAEKKLKLVDSKDLFDEVVECFDGVICLHSLLPASNEMVGIGANTHYCLMDHVYVWDGEGWKVVGQTPDPVSEIPDDGDLEKVTETDAVRDDSSISEAQIDAAPEIEVVGQNSLSASVSDDDKPAGDSESTFSLLDEGGSLVDAPVEAVHTKNNQEFVYDPDASAIEICKSVLSCDDAPTDDCIVQIIRKLLELQKVNEVLNGNLGALSNAIVLAKSASVDENYPNSSELYKKLQLAMCTQLDKCEYTGEALAALFVDPFEGGQVFALAAYCMAMLTPAQSYDYTLRNTASRLCNEFDDVFPSYISLKPLFRRLYEVCEIIPEGFNDSVLDMLSDHAEGMAHLEKMKKSAQALLREPTIKVKMHGLPELCSACFGVKSDLYAALEIVAKGNASERDIVRDVLRSFCEDEEDQNSISEELIETTIDREWKNATKGKSTSRAPLSYLARKQVLDAFHARIEVLKAWVEYDADVDEKHLPSIRRLKSQLLTDVAAAKEALVSVPNSEYPGVVAWMLISIEKKLLSVNEPEWLFADLLYTGIIPMDDDANPIIDASLCEVQYYEPWRIALEHITSPHVSLECVVADILDSQSIYSDNLHQLEMIGRYLNDHSDKYLISDQQRAEAQRSANDKLEEFKNRLELAYTYNRIEENDKETLLAALYSYRDAFYANDDYACWKRFILALSRRIDTIASVRKIKLRADLDACFASLAADATSSLLTEANRLLEEDENFAVTEDYINRFRNGEWQLSDEFSSILHDPDSFAEFISDDVFEPLYRECADRSGQKLSKFGYEYTRKHYPAEWTDRHREDSRRLITSWPAGRGSATNSQIETLFRSLGFNVQKVERDPQHKDGSV